MVKAITRGGDPALYKHAQIREVAHAYIESQDNTYTIQPDALPTEIPYINFDVPNDNSELIKRSLASASSITGKNLQQTVAATFSRGEQHESKYQTLFGVDRAGWYDAFPEISYKLNSLGTRNHIEFDDLTENEFIPAFGDSNTFGMGLPEHELWYNKLGEEHPIYNAGVINGNLTDVYLMMKSMYDSKKFKKAYVCIPHAERWTGVSDAGYFEGIINGAHYFLEQFKDAPEVLNNNTRQLYRWMAVQNIINFCAINDIELKMYQSNTFMHVGWCGEQNLHIPNWYFIFQHMHKNIKIANESGDDISEWPRHTARDLIHFGSEWHDKMAQHLINM